MSQNISELTEVIWQDFLMNIKKQVRKTILFHLKWIPRHCIKKTQTCPWPKLPKAWATMILISLTKLSKNNSVFPLPPGVKNKFGNNLLLGNKKIGMERSPLWTICATGTFSQKGGSACEPSWVRLHANRWTERAFLRPRRNDAVLWLIFLHRKIGMERSPFRRGTPDQSRTGD